MLQHPLLRQALAQVDRLFHHQRARPAPAPPASPAVGGEGAGLAVAAGPAPSPSPPPVGDAPLALHHRRGLEQTRSRSWGRAQRELELAVRADPHGPAAEDLASVRDARRQLRLLAKWPRDPRLHVALGRAYLELDLGEEAEDAFRRAIALAPAEPAAHFYLALEYAYRGALDEAAGAYARAQALADGLPPLAELIAARGGAADTAGSCA